MSFFKSPATNGLPLALVVISASLISMLTFGPRTALGIFQTPILSDFGWDRSTFALGLALQNLMWGIGQPIAGAIADKFGPVRILYLGIALHASGLVLLSQADTQFMHILGSGFLIGFALSAASFNILFAAIGRLVPERFRGLSLGLVTASASLGQFVFSPLGHGFINAYGWSTALLILASTLIVVPFLVMNLSGGISKDKPSSSTAAPIETSRQILIRAFHAKSYILLMLGFFTCGFHVAFIATNLPAYIDDLGFGTSTLPAILNLPFDLQIDFGLGLGAVALALIGLFNIFGSVASGIWSQRIPKPHILSFIYFARAIAFFAFLMLPPSPWSVVLFASILGLLWLSTIPATSGLVVVFFGPQHMGMLYGMVFLCHQIGGFFGAYLGGVSFDLTGNYDLVWWASVILGLGSGILHLPIKDEAIPRVSKSPA